MPDRTPHEPTPITERSLALASVRPSSGASGPERAPRAGWSIDRWIQVLGFAGVVVTGIFWGGGRWTSMERDVAELKADLDKVVESLAVLNEYRLTNTMQLDEVARQLRQLTGDRAERRGPAFPRDAQFGVSVSERQGGRAGDGQPGE